MTLSFKSAALTAAFIFGAAAANAATVTVDFTDVSSYDTFSASSATGMIGTTQTWTATPEPANSLTLTAFDGDAAPTKTPLSFANFDGLGVVDDEIAFPSQFVTLKFSETLQVDGLHFLDVFGDEGVHVYLNGSATAAYSYGAGLSPFAVGASSDGDNSVGGYAFIDLSKINTAVSSITFGAVSGNDSAARADVALAGIDFRADDNNEPEPVPLPAGGALLLTALGGLAIARRRKARAAA